jgi:hypothetical protein
MDQREDIRCHCDGSAREGGHGHESNVGDSGVHVHHDKVHSRETWSDDCASDPDAGDPGLSKVAIQEK